MDTTDYLWYSVNMTVPRDTSLVSLSFQTGAAGGATVFAYVNGELSGSTLGADGSPVVVKKDTEVPIVSVDHGVALTLPASCTVAALCQLDLLSVNMGIQNYGPNLEAVTTGITSPIRLKVRGNVRSVLSPLTHTVGLKGELDKLSQTIDTTKNLAIEVSANLPLQWYTLTFPTPEGESATSPLALELTPAEGAMGKGAVWVNGRMLGRYWGAIAHNMEQSESCDNTCLTDQMTWVGNYAPTRCVSGCGSPSQSIYKLPYDWLKADGGSNTMVLFEEVAGQPSGIKLGKVVMQDLE